MEIFTGYVQVESFFIKGRSLNGSRSAVFELKFNLKGHEMKKKEGIYFLIQTFHQSQISKHAAPLT